jgi:hypothetical protein
MVKSKELSKQLSGEALGQLVKRAGGQTQLAKMITSDECLITPQAVHNWVLRGRISKAGAIAVCKNDELKAEFSLTQLRPDLSVQDLEKLLK